MDWNSIVCEEYINETGCLIKYPKRCVLKYKLDGAFDKIEQWIMSRNIIFVPIYWEGTGIAQSV